MRTSWFSERWSQSNALALAATAHEKTVLDLKERYDLASATHRYELAKDLAAFANALGGTLLVGASEASDESGRRTGRIEAFVPMTDEQALIKAATTAARDMCRPGVTVEPEVIRLTVAEQTTIVSKPLSNDAVLVAFNVHPLVVSPAGVAACDLQGKRISDAYRFPVRFLEGTKWLQPEELAFHMNSHERRMYLLLAALPHDGTVFAWDKGEGRNSSGARRPVRVSELDSARLIVKLELSPQIFAHVPLTFVTAVWTDENGLPNIVVDGALKGALHNVSSRFVPAGSVG